MSRTGALRARSFKLAAVAAGLSLGLAACGGSSGGGSSSGGGGNGNGGGGSQGTPKKGGTLQIAGSGDVDFLDTAAGYYQVTYGLMRAFTRQLMSYPSTNDLKAQVTPVPDVSDGQPQVSADGKTYTFKIRSGVQWNTKPARQVTAADFVRGIDRTCNPAKPFGGYTSYFADPIVGMKAFCDGFQKVRPDDAAAIGAYVEGAGKKVAGLQAVNDTTLKITLTKPRSDFLNILSLTAASAVPVEYNKYVPDSPQMRTHTLSDGPYEIVSYKPNQLYQLDRNPAWKADTDPLRKAYVDKITVKLGSDEGPVFQQIKAGTVDMMWDTGVPVTDLAQALATKDPLLHGVDDGSSNPYIVINLKSVTANGALKKLAVRQALNYAVNKMAISQIYGGTLVRQPIDQILTPPLVGYQKMTPYPTPDHKGDPAKAKQLLAQAGYPSGLTLKFLYRNVGKAVQVATTLQADLKRSGITLKLVPTTANNFYTDYLQNQRATNRGDWDLAAPGWGPDWQGNAAFSFFGPLLDGRTCSAASTNYACYNNPKVNSLIDQALAAKSPEQAAPLWAEADKTVMADAPWVPLVTGKQYEYTSKRTKNYQNLLLSNNGDYTAVWLSS